MYRQSARPSGTCPGCRRALSRVTFAGYHYERCAVCSGIWLERATLAAMWDEMAPGAPLPEMTTRSGPSRPCPTCGDAMTPIDLQTIPLDQCALDGIWFDWPELEVALASAALPLTTWRALFLDRLAKMT